MPVTFVRLRIAGFKSFAEPVSIEILPGLTGIVGPNGCGKSNVVEALRWAMGESSARSLRGSEMDDLIFAGTVARPTRNLAEVVLTVEDASGLLPHDGSHPPSLNPWGPDLRGAELQVSRRIERGVGSAYRINDRDVRARDVQTLFADLSSGARASSMISQNRVAAIVNARPEERRSILEEAAGITGLHGRRQEAELKLRAAEANLLRADDLRAQLDARVQALGSQAAQAGRYRTVASELRSVEAALPALLHERARRNAVVARGALSDAQAALEQAERRAVQAIAVDTEAGQALSAPRDAEATIRSLLERRQVEAEGAAREGERARRDAEQADARWTQAREDHDAAVARCVDARDAEARLLGEQAEVRADDALLPERRRAQEARVRELGNRLQAAERAARADADAAAAAATRRAEHARDRDAASGRLQRAEALLTQVDGERARHEAELPDPALVEAEEERCAAAADALAGSERALEHASTVHAEAVRSLDVVRMEAADAMRRQDAAVLALQQAELRAVRLDDERADLRRRLDAAEAGLVPEAVRRAAVVAVREAEAGLAEAASGFEAAEQARAQATSRRLEAAARMGNDARHRQQLETVRGQAEGAHRLAATQHEALARDHDHAVRALVPAEALAGGRQAGADAGTVVAAAGDALAQAEAALDAAQAVAGDAARHFASARDAHGRLAAEADGLGQALAGQEAPSRAWRVLADELEVPDGLDTVLAAYLGDALDAAHPDDDADAPRGWRRLSPSEPVELPGGAVPLAALVAAPDVLARALSHAGLIEDQAQGDALQGSLRPGQCLVSRDGGLWRWDGYRVAAGQPDAAALRLRQRMRLREARTLLAEAAAAVASAQEAAARLADLRDVAVSRARQARAARDAAEHELARAREAETLVVRRDAETRARLDAVAPQRDRAALARVEADAALAAARAACEALADPDEAAKVHGQAKDREGEALAAETGARAQRQRAEATLGEERGAAAMLAGRQAEARTTLDALAPLLARTAEDAGNAALALAEARTVLAALPPDGGRTALDGALAQATAAETAQAGARALRHAAQVRLDAVAAARDRMAYASFEGQSRLDALSSRLDDARTERDAARDAMRALAAITAELPDAAGADDAARCSAQAVAGVRRDEREAAECRQALAAEHAALDAKRGLVERALADWQARRQAAEAVLEAVATRLAAAQAEHATGANGPAAAAERAEALAGAVLAARQAHDDAQEALGRAVSVAQQAQTERRAAEDGVAAAREAALRAEGRDMQAQAVLSQLQAEAAHPTTAAPADLSDAAETALRRRIAKLNRERDEIGPVNLRAELELLEAEQQGAAIGRERDEMGDAIARLRGQIGHLNRIGRERLVAVFEQVDWHFRTLFTRLFEGGRAHLGLVGSDDPLGAGIEIYAQPPGKKLSTLSLLSGGEQALTALSLVFAVFRCSPAPVCVLDEVDAPLDDNNVERFCALLNDLAGETGTRFLVVTHHQLTMAHMDRLYGVTMQERGVSRVLSVDLARAAAMAE